MAKKTKTITICDLHRGDVEATGTATVIVAGVTYRLDLCAQHLREFTTAVRPWTRRAASDQPIETAPAAKPRRKTAKSTRRRKAGPSNAELREWATASGYEVAAKGRIPDAVREAYAAAK